MSEAGAVVVIGGTQGIGLELARHYQAKGAPVVITGRDEGRAQEVAASVGQGVRGLGMDLTQPETLAAALAEVGPVKHLVITAVMRDHNPLESYDVKRAMKLTTLKLVGYTEAVRVLSDRMGPDSSVVLFGGQAMLRPYPGSTTVTTVNGGVASLIRTLAIQLAPIRVNALHPGVVGDSAFWADKPQDALRAGTPTGRLVTLAEVVDATVFLLENTGVNGVNLPLDGGAVLS